MHLPALNVNTAEAEKPQPGSVVLEWSEDTGVPRPSQDMVRSELLSS